MDFTMVIPVSEFKDFQLKLRQVISADKSHGSAGSGARKRRETR